MRLGRGRHGDGVDAAAARARRAPAARRTTRRRIEAGDERTFQQDPKYAIRLLVDIAIKALSPAINDPTTAVQALDQIEDLLLRLGRRDLDIGDFDDDAGRLRLVVPFPTWDDFLLLALDEIRSCGATSVQVMRRMMALVKHLTEVLPASRTAALQHWEHRLQSTMRDRLPMCDEKKDAAVADRQGLGIGEEKTALPALPAVRPCPAPHLYRVPRLTTMSTRCSRAMWRRTSPRTAMMSAYLPGVTVPTSRSTFIATDGQ